MGSVAGIAERRDATGRTRYRVRVRRGDQTYAGTFVTLAAAIEYRDEALDAAAGIGEAPEPPVRIAARPRAIVTVEEAARRLCRGMVDGTVRARNGRRFKPSTTRAYEEALRLLVLPRIGGLPVATVTRGDVQQLVDEIAGTESVAHARKALTALRVALRVAERYGEIDANPCAGVRAPADDDDRERPARVLSLAETAILVDGAERDDTRFQRSFAAPLVVLALGTGLRLGELLALVWGPEGLDLDEGVVCVRRSLDRHRGDNGTYPIVPPKSRASRRDVPVPPEDVARLLRHRLASGRPGDGTRVFGDVAPHGLPRAAWRRLVHGTAKTPPLVPLAAPAPRFHDLRHTFATHALAAGLSVHAVAELLGHADASLVLARYGHSMPGEVAGAGAALEAWRRSQEVV